MQRDEILLKLRERIVAYAASHLSGDLAEDVAQEVMLLLHMKYSGVSELEDLVPLSLQIARFKIAAHWRKAHRRGENTPGFHRRSPAGGPGPEPERYRREERDAGTAD